MFDLVKDVIVGISASYFFLLILYRRQPRLKFSDVIVRAPEAEWRAIPNEDGIPQKRQVYVHMIKMVNLTRYPLTDVRATFDLLHVDPIPGGVVANSDPIPLKKPELLYLPAYDPKDKVKDFAFRFTIYSEIPLEQLWGEALREHETSYFRLTVTARHSLTGFSKAYEIRFYGSRAQIPIVIGDFEFGESVLAIGNNAVLTN